MSKDPCIFCNIIKGKIPSEKIYETENIFAFMDINPLSPGHCLFIPKKHSRTMDETDDESLSEILIAVKKVAKALELDQYNILENNGSLAHQAVNHVHFHLIPKPSKDLGLKITWDQTDGEHQADMAEKIRNNL